jgi:hypothetical protein
MILICLLSVLLFSTPAEAQTTLIIDGVPLIGQETANSCWAASSIMVLSYYGFYGPDVSQLQLAREVEHEDWYYSTGLILGPWDGLVGTWENGLERLGKVDADLEWTVTEGGLTFDEVVSDIDMNRPVIALKGGNPGHVVVVVGYTDSPGEENDYVILNDPGDGSSIYPNPGSTWSQLWSSFQSQLAIHPIFGIIAPYPQAVRFIQKAEKGAISIHVDNSRSSGFLRFQVGSVATNDWWIGVNKWDSTAGSWGDNPVPGTSYHKQPGETQIVEVDLGTYGPGNYRLGLSVSMLEETTWTVTIEYIPSHLDLENMQTWASISTSLASVARADVDGDGSVEIITGGHYWDGNLGFAQLCVWEGATLALENVRTWQWGISAHIFSVAVGDVDGDGKQEIVTGGLYIDDFTAYIAQLCIWDGATLSLENVQTWQWGEYTPDWLGTVINSVAIGDVDGDGNQEIVTGGNYFDGTRDVAQLVVWTGASLALESVKTWYWTDDTVINSVAVGDVDGDGKVEIVTGGCYDDGTCDVAQLCVWDGATLALENVECWFWTGNTGINSVAVGDVDGDANMEVVTGGYYWDVTHNVAQLCVWNGATLSLENVETWYWTSSTGINSVAVGDVDVDGSVEIVTGGLYSDGDLGFAQLCVWDGATLALENVQTWQWAITVSISEVAVGDVDGDSQIEIITGGCFYATGCIAQLCVWEVA